MPKNIILCGFLILQMKLWWIYIQICKNSQQNGNISPKKLNIEETITEDLSDIYFIEDNELNVEDSEKELRKSHEEKIKASNMALEQDMELTDSELPFSITAEEVEEILKNATMYGCSNYTDINYNKNCHEQRYFFFTPDEGVTWIEIEIIKLDQPNIGIQNIEDKLFYEFDAVKTFEIIKESNIYVYKCVENNSNADVHINYNEKANLHSQLEKITVIDMNNIKYIDGFDQTEEIFHKSKIIGNEETQKMTFMHNNPINNHQPTVKEKLTYNKIPGRENNEKNNIFNEIRNVIIIDKSYLLENIKKRKISKALNVLKKNKNIEKVKKLQNCTLQKQNLYKGLKRKYFKLKNVRTVYYTLSNTINHHRTQNLFNDVTSLNIDPSSGKIKEFINNISDIESEITKDYDQKSSQNINPPEDESFLNIRPLTEEIKKFENMKSNHESGILKNHDFTSSQNMHSLESEKFINTKPLCKEKKDYTSINHYHISKILKYYEFNALENINTDASKADIESKKENILSNNIKEIENLRLKLKKNIFGYSYLMYLPNSENEIPLNDNASTKNSLYNKKNEFLFTQYLQKKIEIVDLITILNIKEKSCDLAKELLIKSLIFTNIYDNKKFLHFIPTKENKHKFEKTTNFIFNRQYLTPDILLFQYITHLCITFLNFHQKEFIKNHYAIKIKWLIIYVSFIRNFHFQYHNEISKFLFNKQGKINILNFKIELLCNYNLEKSTLITFLINFFAFKDIDDKKNIFLSKMYLDILIYVVIFHNEIKKAFNDQINSEIQKLMIHPLYFMVLCFLKTHNEFYEIFNVHNENIDLDKELETCFHEIFSASDRFSTEKFNKSNKKTKKSIC